MKFASSLERSRWMREDEEPDEPRRLARGDAVDRARSVEWMERKERVGRALQPMIARKNHQITNIRYAQQPATRLPSLNTTGRCDEWGAILHLSACTFLVLESNNSTSPLDLSGLIEGILAAPRLESLLIDGFSDDNRAILIRATRSKVRRLIIRSWLTFETTNAVCESLEAGLEGLTVGKIWGGDRKRLASALAAAPALQKFEMRIEAFDPTTMKILQATKCELVLDIADYDGRDDKIGKFLLRAPLWQSISFNPPDYYSIALVERRMAIRKYYE